MLRCSVIHPCAELRQAVGSQRWRPDLLQEAAGVNPLWVGGHTADGKVCANNPF